MALGCMGTRLSWERSPHSSALIQDRNAGLSDARARGQAIAAQFLNRAVAMKILTPSASVGLRLHLLHDLVQGLLNVEGCGFLSLRKFLEGLEELSHDGLRRNHDPELIAIPTRIHPSIRRHLERVLPK